MKRFLAIIAITLLSGFSLLGEDQPKTNDKKAELADSGKLPNMSTKQAELLNAATLVETAGRGLTFRKQVKVLEVKKPWLSVYNTIVIRVSDEEWEKLVKAYPPSALQNTDGKNSLTFMADDPKQ